MAKAVKAAVTIFVVTFAVMSGAIFVFGTAGVGGAAATLFGVTAMEMAALSAISTLVGGLMSKGIKATASENFGNKVATRTATAPRQIIYGKARVGGTITHIETSGTDNYKLSMVVVLAGHEVESLEDVLINDEILTTVSSGGFEYATNSKFVNADNENKFSVQSSLLRYVFVDGSQTTANSTVVNNTSLTSSDKFIGMSYVLIEMVVDSEAFGGGIPPMGFVVKGKKVYDPRTSSTAWSDNPALCVRDYITDTTYGLKATSSEVLDTTALGGFASAANTCDSGNTIGTATVNGATSSSIGVTVDTSSTLTLIDVGQTVTGTGISGVVKVVRRRGLLITLSSAQTIADGVTLTFTEELYTANGITNMSASGSGVIEGLLSACAGKLSYIDGKFVMFAGASVSPDMTITDDNLLAPISIATKQSSGESFNTVKAVYVDANNNYVATDSPTETPINPDSSVTFLSEDTPTGESQPNYRKTLEIQLPFTDTTTMAQRLQRTALLHTRKEVSLSVLCNIAYMQLQPFDWVYLTNERLGYTNKTFEVLSTNLDVIESDDVPVLATRLALKEIDSSVYAFASSSYTSPIDEGTSVSTGSFSVTAPTGLSVSATLINTGYDLQVQWTNNPDDLIQGTEILYGTSSGTYIGSLIAGKGKTKEIIPNVKANSVYYIVARHFSANNVFSANTSEININTNSGTGIATPSAPTSLSATTGKPLSIGLSWSNPSSTDLRDIKIYRSTTSGFTPNDGTNLVRTIAGVPSVTQKVSFGVDDGLVSGTTYYFKVKAVSFFDKVSSASSQASGSFTKVDSGDIDLPDFSGYFHKEGNTTTALTSSQFNTEYGRTPLNDDILIMVNTSSSPKTSKAYKWNGSSFVEITNFTTGDLVVDGTIAGDKLVARTITADEISTGTLTSASGVFGSISAGDIDTGTLNAANVTISGGDVTINNSGIAISGSSSSINLGSGAFIVTSGGGLTATNAIITGEVNATSGTFNGSIAIGSGNNIFKADTNGIYLGNTSYASALFKVSPAGVVQSDKRITSGTGTTQATLSGEDTTYRFWSGGTSGSTADFSVSKTGEIIAKKISIYNNEGGLIFSSDAGFSDLALTQISAVTGTPVQSVSDTFSANGDTSASWQSITLVANTNLTVSVSLNTLFGGDGTSNTSSNDASDNALITIPDDFTLQMQYSSDGGSNWNNIIITQGAVGTNPVSQEFEKTISTNPSAQQYSVEITTESEPAFFVAFADVRKGNTLSNYGSVDANGFTNITGTITNLAGTSSGTTYKFRTLVTTDDSGYNPINKVTATAPRTLTITDTSGSGFYIDNGDGSQTVPTGDITSVSVTTASNSGLTGGQTFSSGAASFTLALASSIDGNKTFTNNVIIGGDLTVQGTTTTIDTTNLDVKDKNITLNYGTGDTSGNANGAGITIQDAVNSTTDATLTWNTSNDSFNFSHPVNVTGNVTATAYYGDGSNLTGITGTATTINNNADNRIITGSGTANTLNAESGLTYNGSTLAVTGAITSTGSITASQNIQLGSGYNLSWGGTFANNSPTIAAAVNRINFYPTGATDGEVIRIDADGIDMNSHNLTEVANITASGTINSGAITSTGDISGATIEGYDFPSYPSQSGGVLTSTVSGDMAWSFNTVSSYVNSGFDRVITSTSSTGIEGEYGLTYNKNSGLQLHNYNGTGGLSSLSTLTLGQSSTNSGNSELILDSKSQGSIRFKDGSTVDGSITYEGVFNNKLQISSATIRLSGAVEMSGALTLSNTAISGVNQLAFNDPGPNEGISFTGGNIKIYESPNDLTTNTAGNLQVVYGGTRRLSVSNTGIDVNGTINSGAIDSSGTSNFDSIQLTDASRLGFGTVKAGATIAHTASVDEGIFWHSTNAYGIYRTSGAWSSPFPVLKIAFATGVEIDGGTAGLYGDINFSNSNLKMGGTQFLDTSRNLSSIGTINSGAITSTGASSFTDLAIGGAADANYDLKVYGLSRFQGTTNFVSSGNVIQIGGQTILDSSRNLTNIKNISATGVGVTPFIFTGTSTSLVHKIGSATQTQYASTIWETDDGLGQIWKTGSAYTAWGGADALNIYNSNGSIAFHPSNTANVLKLTSTGATITGAINVNSAGAGSIAGFRGDNYNQVNIAHTSNTGWGMLLTNSNSTSNSGYHNSTSGANNSIAIVNVNNDALHFGTNNGLKFTIDHLGNLKHGTSQTTILDTSRNLSNIGTISSGNITLANNSKINLWTTAGSSGTGTIHMPRAGFITFYGDESTHHSISSRNSAGVVGDDLRINSYGAVSINLDSNNNNSSAADFLIGRHGGATGTISDLFRINGETGVITQTISNVGIPTLYSSFTMEATDAQLDLVSSSAGTWGSAINFVEGASTTANTNNWSIARKTSGGGNTLNFNFGTANQHDNTTRMTFASDGAITATGFITGTRLRVGDGNDGYFYSDTNGRTAFAGGEFYIQTSVNNFYNYATNQYYGYTSGDTIHFRGNVITANNWGIPASGTITSTGIRTGTGQARVKLGVWSDNTYGIGMQTGYTYGGLNNDYAMSFQMNSDNDRGFWWGDSSHTNAQGAMSLTTQGRLTVAEGIRVGYGETDTVIPSAGLAVNGAITSTGTVTATNIHSDGGNLIMGDQAYSASNSYVGMKTSFQSGSNDYMILSGVSDGETYVSAKDGSATNIRGGGNNSNNQIVVPDGNYISMETSNLRFNGNLQTGTTTVIDASRNIVSANNTLSGNLRRTAHNVGHLEGSYNNVGSNSDKTNPIYTIGSAYNPSATSVGGMYGIGYAHPNLGSWGSNKSSGWGLYVAEAGSIHATISRGGMWSDGAIESNTSFIVGSTATVLSQSGVQLRIQTTSGYCEIGPANSSWMHFETDRGKFYFNTAITVDSGIVSSYDEDLILRRANSSSHQLTVSTSGITATGNVTAYSDERLKENIQTLDSKKALQMRGVSFIKDGVEGSGVIAQEIEEIAPELVLTADDEMGTKSVAYGNLVGYLIETVKDQQKQIDELKQRLDNDSSN